MILCAPAVLLAALLLPPPAAPAPAHPLDLMGPPSSWSVTVDGVMGGKSTATVTPDSDGKGPAMTFAGVVRVAGGGFASARRFLPQPVDLRPYAGIVVDYDVRAPTEATGGQTPLGLRLSLHPSSSNWAFGAAFAVAAASTAASAGGAGQAFMPLGAFVRATRGPYTCNDCTFDPSQVREIDLYNLFQAGTFAVRVRGITAVPAPQPSVWVDPGLDVRLQSRGAIAADINGAIARGAYVYDKGYPEVCAAVYRQTALGLLKATATDAASRRALCGALALDADSDATAAWGLRRAFDAVLAARAVLDAGGSAAGAEAAVREQDQAGYPPAVQGSWTYEGAAGANCSQATGHPADWATVSRTAGGGEAFAASGGARAAGAGASALAAAAIVFVALTAL